MMVDALTLHAFTHRSKAALLASPLEAAADMRRYGCHVIAGVAVEPEFVATAKPAAVLVPVVMRANGLSLVLTERAAHLSAHAGQVAFPGGRIEAGETPQNAALREAEEEIGLAPEAVTPLGFLPPYFSGTGYRVTPLVGVVAEDACFAPDANEVARIFEVPLSHVLDLARYEEGSLFWRGRERRFYTLPHEEARIWGVTAGILRSFAEIYERGRAYGAGHI